MEERLQNIELHLGHSVVPDNDSPSAVYQRLRACEDRILELEKVAPCREFLHFLRLKKLAEHQGISQSVDVDAALIAGMVSLWLFAVYSTQLNGINSGAKEKSDPGRKQKEKTWKTRDC